MKKTIIAAGLITAMSGAFSAFESPSASAMSLDSAVRIAVDSNPEIGKAIANREAIEFELRQGRGLYLPRIDLEGDLGAQNRDSRSTHRRNKNDHVYFRKQGGVVLRQLLFDGFETDSEVEHQASRVDGASYRVRERSEFIALAVIREYLDIYRLRRIVQLAKKNEAYHRNLLGKIERGAIGGSLSIADKQQAQERLFASRASIDEQTEELKAAEARFLRLVGRPAGKVSASKNIKRALPSSLSKAIGKARVEHPSIKIAKADIDASAALVRKAESNFYPKVTLEGRAIAGDDIGGQGGHDHDMQAKVVVGWNIYKGGIDRANRQEQIRRVDEERMNLHQISREIEEAVRLSWERRHYQQLRLNEMLRQKKSVNQLLRSYYDQFQIGERSLLDLLDTQNSLYAVGRSVETARVAVQFAEYRVLAATGSLLNVMGVNATEAATPYARVQAKVPETPPAEAMSRYSPDRTGSGLGPLY